MNLEITNQTCEDIVYNGHYLDKLYFGQNLVWEKQQTNPYEYEYLTIEALEAGTVGMYNGRSISTTVYTSLDDGTTWTSNVMSSRGASFHIPVAAGQKVLFKRNASVSTGTGSSWTGNDSTLWYRNCLRFWCTCQYKVYGNIQSLWYGDDFVGKTLITNRTTSGSTGQVQYGMSGLFTEYYSGISINVSNNVIDPPIAPPTPSAAITDVSNITTDTLNNHYLIDAENLVIPISGKATIGNSLNQSNYLSYTCFGMFYGCSCLKKASIWHNIDFIGQHDFDYMYAECVSLLSAPYKFDAYIDGGGSSDTNGFVSTFQDCLRLVDGPTIIRAWTNLNDITGTNGGSGGTFGHAQLWTSTNTFLNCQSLVTAPKLYCSSSSQFTVNWSVFNSNYYSGMFGNCRSLQTIKMFCHSTNPGSASYPNTINFYTDGSYTISPTITTNMPYLTNIPSGWNINYIDRNTFWADPFADY